MKFILQISLVGILTFSFVSCKKSTTSPTSSTTTEIFDIIINGQTFNKTFKAGIIDFSGFYKETCDNKTGYLINVYGSDLNSQYSVYSDLQYYYNDVDFKSKGTGVYSLTSTYPSNPCHFSLNLSLNDNSQPNNNTSLQSGGVHTVTSISTVSSSSDKRQVLIEGTFSGTYKNSANSNIVVTGKYKKIVVVLL